MDTEVDESDEPEPEPVVALVHQPRPPLSILRNWEPLLKELLAVTDGGSVSGLVGLDLVQRMMDVWLGGSAERWQIPKRRPLNHLVYIRGLLSHMGFFVEEHGSLAWYDYVVIVGATVPVMQGRLAFCAFLCRTFRVRCGQVVLLTGARPLNEVADTPMWRLLPVSGSAGPRPRRRIPYCHQDGLPLSEIKISSEDFRRSRPAQRTEADAARHLLTLPLVSNLWPGWPPVSVLVVEVPLHSDGRRPGVRDCARKWLQDHRPNGRALFIASQPHLHRMKMDLEDVLQNSGVVFEIAGPGLGVRSLELTKEDGHTSNVLEVTLDEVARTVQALLQSATL